LPSTTLALNGINVRTGRYLLPDLTPEDVFSHITGKDTRTKPAPDHLADLKQRSASKSHYGLADGYDPKDLAQTGWGVIFAFGDDHPIEVLQEALEPLLSHRREQAGALYREFTGIEAYQDGESKSQFLARSGAGPGQAHPKRTKVPYYLLIVGSPERIPYSFQYELDVQYAVGRIQFETLEEYHHYACSVAFAERMKVKRARRVTLFGVRNPDDPATKLSSEKLVSPLAETLRADQPDWEVLSLPPEETTKTRLASILEDDDGPALLFTASHGMGGFDPNDPRQFTHQGALLCQDWPGPQEWPEDTEIPEEHYFSGDDVRSDARLSGLVSFHFACYGAGTPREDSFAHLNSEEWQDPSVPESSDIASRAFVARLPQSLLARSDSGALAVIGHIERAWGYSFMWPGAGEQIDSFESALKRLMDGHPVGSALESFNQRYADISPSLTAVLEDVIRRHKKVDAEEVVGLWTANNDARNYVIVGDPAVRLAV
jgi:hypothetical protein